MPKVAQPKLTEGSWNALRVIRGFNEGATLAQLNENATTPISPAHLTQLARFGLVLGVPTEFVCPLCGSKASRKVWTITDAGVVYNE